MHQRQRMTKTTARMLRAVVIGLTVAIIAAPAVAAECGNNANGFAPWLQAFKARAAADGISARGIKRALDGVSYDRNVIYLDRNQKSFKKGFDEFYRIRVGPQIRNRGRGYMKKHAAMLDKIEQRFGVPREIIIAIWGLETYFGSDGAGKKFIPRSLATLSYDCRRSEFFTRELLASMKIIDRGDMPVSDMRGGWAGEIGQTQFLPSWYVKYAVDFNGNGRKDMLREVPDILASTANVLKGFGWRRGEGWGEGTHNHMVIREWNRAGVYRKTIAKFAYELRGG